MKKHKQEGVIDVRSPSLASPGHPGRQANLLSVTAESTVYQGPLPHPDVLKAYGEAQPDLIERIVCMAEKEQEHRHATETLIIQSEIQRARRSVYCGLAVALAGFVTAGVLGGMGFETAAAVVGGLDLVGLVSVFVLGRWKREAESTPPQPPS